MIILDRSNSFRTSSPKRATKKNMADDTTVVTDDKTTQDPTKATDAANQDKGSDQFDTSKLTDDQINKVLEDKRLWNTQRLKELRDKAKRADDFDAAEKKRLDDEAIKKGDYEKVLTEKDKRIQELEGAVSGSKIDNAITIAAQKAGAVDANAVLKLIDRTGITIGDNGVAGADEAVKALLEASPYLKGNGQTKTVGSASNPGADEQGVRTFKSSQLKDRKFYKENEAEILKAWKAGKIEDDESPK